MAFCHLISFLKLTEAEVVRPAFTFRVFHFTSRTTWLILTKLNGVINVPYKCCCFRHDPPRIHTWQDQNMSWRDPHLTNFSFMPNCYTQRHNKGTEIFYNKCVRNAFRCLLGDDHFCIFLCKCYRFLFGEELNLHKYFMSFTCL